MHNSAGDVERYIGVLPDLRELICDLINEVQIPVARVGDPKPGVAFEGDVVRILSME